MEKNDFYIERIVNNGNNPDEELIVFLASGNEQKVDIGGYALIDQTFDTDGKSNIHRHVFIFPDVKISNGDVVFLYTGKGKIKSFKNQAGSYTHCFYINSDECIWNNNDRDTAILWKYNVVDRKPVPKNK